MVQVCWRFFLVVAGICVLAGCIDFTPGTKTCGNGAKDGDETDVDCGEVCGVACSLQAGCSTAADCVSQQCNAVTHVCTEGPCADGIKNNQETDIDCGGGGSCAKCEVHATCSLPTDCFTDHCDANSRCEPYPLTWSTLPSRLCGRDHAMAAMFQESVFVAGITRSCDAVVTDAASTVESYVQGSPWAESAVLKIYAREGGALLTSGPNVFVVGGFNDSSTAAYSSTQGSAGALAFKALTSMNQGRAYFAATSLPDGRLFVAGGHPTDATLDVNATASTEYFTPDATLATGGIWTPGPPLGIYRAAAGAAASRDGRIFVMGGVLKFRVLTPLNNVEVFPSSGGAPTSLPPMPLARSGFGITRGADGRIYVAGGDTPTGVTASVMAYDPDAGVWTSLSNLPAAVTRLALVMGPDYRLYAIPGEGASPIQSAFVLGPRVSLGTTSAAPGATISMQGYDFLPSVPFGVYLDDLDAAPVQTGVTRPTGQLPASYVFTVPAGTAAGKHQLFVRDEKTRYPIRAVFEVP
jgi:hypothetical protein